MKTNIILSSIDRKLFGITIRQNTKDKFLNINDLQKSYETARWQYGWSDSSISQLMRNPKLQERLYYLLFERNLIKVGITTFMEMVEREGVVNVLKGLGVWNTTGRGEGRLVMVDPYIWVLLAMELNPMIYAKVIMWLTDSLIFDRIDAGDKYRPMNIAINSLIKEPDYYKFAMAINEKVFGLHKTAMRNLANAKELRRITTIEEFIINAIKNKWIKDEKSILEAIRNYE